MDSSGILWYALDPDWEPTDRGLAPSGLLGQLGHVVGKAAGLCWMRMQDSPFGQYGHGLGKDAGFRWRRMEDSPLPRMSRHTPRRKLQATPLPRIWLATSRYPFGHLFGDLVGNLCLCLLMFLSGIFSFICRFSFPAILSFL